MVEAIKIEDVFAHLEMLLAQGDIARAAEYLRSLHPADSAEVLAMLEVETQALLVDQLEPPEVADVFEQMDEDESIEIVQQMDSDVLADVLDEMEPDMAADLLGELSDEDAAKVIDRMDEAATVVPLLSYPEDTAGGIMNVAPPSLRRFMTVEESFKFVKEHYHDAAEVFYLYVLDRNGMLIGVVNLRSLILADMDQTIEEIMQRDVISVHVEMDQEEVAALLARYDLLGLPVVDTDEKLVGIITVDDVVDVLEEEATEDIYRLAQLSEQADIFSPVHRAARNRLPWLYVNMGTAIMASVVVALFEQTIAAVAMLAVFMPIVAGMGGNGGNQSMTIVVRSLALGEMGLENMWRALRHELLLGLINGLLLGMTIGVVAWLWQGSPMMGVIIGVAMLANMLVAALAGVLVPTTLKRLNVDPALASSVFVTTATDIMGFGVFLGLATYFLGWL